MELPIAINVGFLERWRDPLKKTGDGVVEVSEDVLGGLSLGRPCHEIRQIDGGGRAQLWMPQLSGSGSVGDGWCLDQGVHIDGNRV